MKMLCDAIDCGQNVIVVIGIFSKRSELVLLGLHFYYIYAVVFKGI
jgi:hypothetical protein